MEWAKGEKFSRKMPLESTVPGRHNRTINAELGHGDIIVLARSIILKNNLNPRWSPIQIPVHW
jgi:hypothetical protein